MNKLFSALIISVAVVSLSANMASAATLEKTFSSADRVHLVKADGRLYSINDDINSTTVRVFKRRSNGNWINVSHRAIANDMTSSLTSVDGTIAFENRVYVGGQSTDGDYELWRKCRACGQPWVQVVGDNFGQSGTLAMADMFKFDGKLYALVNNTDTAAATLYKSRNGMHWTEVGPVSSGGTDLYAVDAGVMSDGTNTYVVVSVSGADPLDPQQLYRANVNDLTTWEATVSLDEITGVDMSSGIPYAMQVRNNVVVVEDMTPNGAPVEVYATTDGLNFTQLGQSGLTDDHLENAVSFIRKYNDVWYIGGVQSDPSIYAYNAADDRWDVAYVVGRDTGNDPTAGRTVGQEPMPTKFARLGSKLYQPVYVQATNRSVIVSFEL